jgi:hypothetical protein
MSILKKLSDKEMYAQIMSGCKSPSACVSCRSCSLKIQGAVRNSVRIILKELKYYS